MKRTWLFIAVFFSFLLPGFAATRVSVQELEAILAKDQGMPDAELAAQLSDLQLTERFSRVRLDQWRSAITGERAQRALIGLADRSAFLEPPAADIPPNPEPSLAEQRRIMGLAATYVSHAIPQLPRLFATRTTTYFVEDPDQAGTDEPVGPLHPVRLTRATVTYRDGEEIVAPTATQAAKTKSSEQGLETWGTFGPILGVVLVDAAENQLQWSHWEQRANGPVAVFSYAVPKEKSHYEVRYCCVAATYGLVRNSFSEMSAYRGEITVDPANGTILRLTIQAQLQPDDPVSKAAIAVEYAPVELGGATYICPTQSVSISFAKTLRQVQDPSGRSWPAMGPSHQLLNHAEFSQYHLFHTDSRVLSAGEARRAGLAPDVTVSNNGAQADAQPLDEDLSDGTTPNTDNANATASADNGKPAKPAAPEITTAAATSLPDSPVHPADQQEAQPSGITLRVTTRLVDVNVVALDKKGHPITGLKPEDFEVDDNGVRQDIRSFMQADAPEAAKPVDNPVPAPAAQTFSNRSESPASPSGSGGNTIVLLIDPSNLSFPDFADARQQLIRFLRSTPPTERVALYAMHYHGFQILEEGSTDHASIVDKLTKWMPTAQDLLNARDEEQRNRQQIETVHSPEDLLSVNGNYTMDSAIQYQALDPKLRELGSNPGPNALFILVDVAHHLGAIPGHKSLVWVTSDNSLADWNKLSLNIEKGAKYIAPAALHAQEAMNNAHVSVYPLDASRLEAAVINAEIGNRNVELTPTYQRPPLLEQEMEGPEASAGQDMNAFNQNRNFGNGSRLQASMEQDLHAIQGVFREVADATGGRAFRRSSNIVGELDGVVADGHATYLLGFTPSQPADGKYHQLTVRLIGHRDAQVRYRTGYEYDKEPTTLKERFAQAVWQPADASEIAVSAKKVSDAAGDALRITVAGSDLDLSQQDAAWAGKLDIFLVLRDQEALHAKVSGITVGLHLKPATYEHAIKEGLTFDERLDNKSAAASYRVVVVDVNSGRIGSVTVPSTALQAMR